MRDGSIDIRSHGTLGGRRSECSRISPPFLSLRSLWPSVSFSNKPERRRASVASAALASTALEVASALRLSTGRLLRFIATSLVGTALGALPMLPPFDPEEENKFKELAAAGSSSGAASSSSPSTIPVERDSVPVSDAVRAVAESHSVATSPRLSMRPTPARRAVRRTERTRRVRHQCRHSIGRGVESGVSTRSIAPIVAFLFDASSAS